jgi:radical SAM protein with 4Fe4S-binding SPASM domain
MSENCKIACYVPWQNMIVGADGNVSPCSFYQGFGNDLPFIGNVNKESIAEIWNGKGYQNLRRFMLSEEGRNGCPNCLAMKQGNYSQPMTPPKDFLNENPHVETSKPMQNLKLVLQEIADNKTEIKAQPASISYTNSHACNFRCTMCYQDDSRDLRLEKRNDVDQQILGLMDTLIQVIAGGGEPFMLPIWRRFLNEFSPERNPVLTFATTTNGSLLDEKTLDKVKRFPNCILNFSLDATHKALFEEIRLRADWDIVYQNLLNCLAHRGSDSNARFYVSACMTVMRSNFSEIPAFLRMMSRHRFPIGFSPLNVYPIDEAISLFNDAHQDLRRFREILDEAKRLFESDPVLREGHYHAFLKHMEAIETMIPFGLLDIPHFEVSGKLPAEERRLIDPLEVNGVPWRVALYDQSSGQLKYWAAVERDGTFKVKLPAGDYLGGLNRRNSVPSPNFYWRMRVTPRSTDKLERAGTMETTPTVLVKMRQIALRLPQPVQNALRWVKNIFRPKKRVLPIQECESKRCA